LVYHRKENGTSRYLFLIPSHSMFSRMLAAP
jgi:hypothetical protein